MRDRVPADIFGGEFCINPLPLKSSEIPMRAWKPHCLFATLALFCSAAAIAGSDDEDLDHWSISAGGQVDDQSNTAYNASVGYEGTIDANWLLAASHSTSSTDFSGITTDYAAFEFWHHGEHRGIAFGAHWFTHDGVAQALEATMSVPLHWRHLHVTLDTAARRIVFEKFQSTTTVTLRDGTLLPVNAIADCNANNSGYGVEAGIDGFRVTGYVRGMKYKYGSTDCTFNQPNLNLLRRATRDEFRQLAAVVTQRLALLTASQIQRNNDADFLDHVYEGGVNLRVGRATFGVVYQTNEDEFADLTTNVYALSADLLLFSKTDLRIEVGSTQTDGIDSVAFAGMQFTMRF